MKKTFKIKTPKIKVCCQSCNGTGLYQGMAERGGSAVECVMCKSKGWVYPSKTDVKYKVFKKRIISKKIKRVFESACGYVMNADDVEYEDEDTKEKKVLHFTNYGATYKEWLDGKVPVPMKELYCPYIYRNEGVGNEPLEDCKIYCRGFGSISKCIKYDHKSECWEQYEKLGKAEYLKEK